MTTTKIVNFFINCAIANAIQDVAIRRSFSFSCALFLISLALSTWPNLDPWEFCLASHSLIASPQS